MKGSGRRPPLGHSAGVNNAFPLGSARMMVPLIRYGLTKDDRYIREAALFMAITPEVLDQDTLWELVL